MPGAPLSLVQHHKERLWDRIAELEEALAQLEARFAKTLEIGDDE
jgi:hypothetical protein